jgi:hypothetical protein
VVGSRRAARPGAGRDGAPQSAVVSPVRERRLGQYVIHQSPGIYVLLCFMNTQDGREHTRLGMERTIKITK